MMRRKRWWWALMVAGALSACGGGSSSSSGGANDAGAARVVLSATGPAARVAAGNTAVLDVVVTNTGMATATHVVTTVFAFAGARLAGVDCTASGGAVCPFAAQVFPLTGLLVESTQLTTSTLPPQGSLHFRVTELILPGVSGPTTTRVSVTADGQAVAADTQSDVVAVAYVVQLTVSGGALAPTVAPGGTATYVMSLSNAGPDAALNVRVTNDAGPQQSLVSATCSAAGGAVCPAAASNGATMTVPSLPVGGSLLFTITAAVAADATGVLSDVFAAIDPGDRFGSDNLRNASIEATPSAPGSFLTLRSAPGEPLGQGAAYAYTKADAVVTVSNDEDNLLILGVDGNESWHATVRFPGPPGKLRPGSYRFAPPAAGTVGVFVLSGNANGCAEADTDLVIDSVDYVGASLSAIDLHFDQTCRGSTVPLHGRLHWTAADPTQPPGPLDPAPAALWRAPAGSLPSAGNYIYLASEPGDVLGGGKTTVLTQANAIFGIGSTVPGQLDFHVQADDDVNASFRGIATDVQLQRGFRGPLQSWPTSNPTTGSMRWSMGGLGCNAASGWFVIDDIRYSGSTVTSVDARFEQHCNNAPAALRGQIHWAPGDPTLPPGPAFPPPADLWSPPAGATPAAGNYVYLQSDPGDFVGGGATWLFAAANSTITASATGADVNVAAAATGGGFNGEFVGMNSIALLQRGYYSGLKRFPVNNPTKGGLMVALLGGCNALSGWFVVDDVAYVGGTLTSIDLRFEQHCEGAAPALHGKIHWSIG